MLEDSGAALREPLRVEMQDNLRLAVVLPNHPRELRTVLNVNDVACLALQIYRNLPRNASVRQAGGRNRWSARRKSRILLARVKEPSRWRSSCGFPKESRTRGRVQRWVAGNPG